MALSAAPLFPRGVATAKDALPDTTPSHQSEPGAAGEEQPATSEAAFCVSSQSQTGEFPLNRRGAGPEHKVIFSALDWMFEYAVLEIITEMFPGTNLMDWWYI